MEGATLSFVTSTEFAVSWGSSVHHLLPTAAPIAAPTTAIPNKAKFPPMKECPIAIPNIDPPMAPIDKPIKLGPVFSFICMLNLPTFKPRPEKYGFRLSQAKEGVTIRNKMVARLFWGPRCREAGP